MTILEAIKAARERGQDWIYLPADEHNRAARCPAQTLEMTVFVEYGECGEWYGPSAIDFSEMCDGNWTLDDPTKGKV